MRNAPTPCGREEIVGVGGVGEDHLRIERALRPGGNRERPPVDHDPELRVRVPRRQRALRQIVGRRSPLHRAAVQRHRDRAQQLVDRDPQVAVAIARQAGVERCSTERHGDRADHFVDGDDAVTVAVARADIGTHRCRRRRAGQGEHGDERDQTKRRSSRRWSPSHPTPNRHGKASRRPGDVPQIARGAS